jgi:hypothetical protein
MVRVPFSVRLMIRALALLCGFGAWTDSAAAQKTDIITLDNGDTITCEIKKLERGRLRCKTDAMGTIYIKWEHIVGIDTDKTLEVEMETGQRYFGNIRPSETPGDMTVTIGQASTEVRNDEVAFVQQIRPTFWGKLDGDIDLGAGYTQSDDQFDYTLNASSTYTGLLNTFQVDLSSAIRVRDNETTNNRQSLSGQWYRQMKWERWFSVTLLKFERNDELDIDIRGTGGYGIGRFLAQTNKWTWNAFASALYSREQYLGEESGNNNFEAGFGTNLQVFTFGDNETDISTNFIFLPSVSDAGRYRLQWNAKLKREFIRDFYLSIDLFENYDSRPPQTSANRNDFGISMALGWTY